MIGNARSYSNTMYHDDTFEENNKIDTRYHTQIDQRHIVWFCVMGCWLI